MTNEEAIGFIYLTQDRKLTKHCKDKYDEALKVIASAVIKQIAVNPMKDSDTQYSCPCCNHEYVKYYKYCWNCGQHLTNNIK